MVDAGSCRSGLASQNGLVQSNLDAMDLSFGDYSEVTTLIELILGILCVNDVILSYF